MNREFRRDLFELIGIIAVVVSLGVLIIEVRQNTSALYAASRQALLETATGEILLLFDNPDVTMAMFKAPPLTEEEQLRLDTFWAASLRGREFAWLQYESGGIGKDLFNTELAVLHLIFDSSRARLWWRNVGRGYFSEGFIAFVDAELEKQPATDTLWKASTTWME